MNSRDPSHWHPDAGIHWLFWKIFAICAVLFIGVLLIMYINKPAPPPAWVQFMCNLPAMKAKFASVDACYDAWRREAGQ